MYQPRPQKEPSGCFQTIIITKIIVQILAVPLLMIGGGIAAVLFFFFTLTVSPFLALLVIVIAGLLLYWLGRWESKRVQRETSGDDV
jgi:hypothetical protein